MDKLSFDNIFEVIAETKPEADAMKSMCDSLSKTMNDMRNENATLKARIAALEWQLSDLKQYTDDLEELI